MPLITEKNIRFKAVRPSGPGGQKAGRRSTKVEMWVKVNDLPLSDNEKKLVRKKLIKHINRNDEIEVICEQERFQALNRKIALEHLNNLITEALKVPAVRLPTKPPPSVENTRIRKKILHSNKKKERSWRIG